MTGVIIRNLSSKTFSNIRIDKLFPLDEYGIIGDKKFYYLVPKINHTNSTSLDADESMYIMSKVNILFLGMVFNQLKYGQILQMF